MERHGYVTYNRPLDHITEQPEKGARKKIHYSCEGRKEKSIPQDHLCHHSASLVMPNGDPRDGFFYSTLTLMIVLYSNVDLFVTVPIVFGVLILWCNSLCPL